jgi:hypothetical protein
LVPIWQKNGGQKMKKANDVNKQGGSISGTSESQPPVPFFCQFQGFAAR